MNRTVSFSLVALLLLILSSCATNYYQVVTVKPISDIRKEGDRLVYEDQNCRIEYNFWCQGGDPGFSVFNKTDKDLFIHKDRCFYVFNGYANNYFKGREYTEGASRSLSSSIGTSLSSIASTFVGGSLSAIFGNGAASLSATDGTAVEGKVMVKDKATKGVSSSVMIPEEQIAIIPPHATKVFGEYDIFNKIYTSCDLKENPSKNEEATIHFTQNNSPINFSNVISYSFDKSGEELTHIDHKFYIESFSNHPESRFIKNEKVEAGCPGKSKKVTVSMLPYAAPERFWNPIGKRSNTIFGASLSGGIGFDAQTPYNATITAGVALKERRFYIGLGAAVYDEPTINVSGFALQGTWNIMSSKFTPVVDLKLFGGEGFGAALGAGVKYRFTEKFGLSLMAEGAYLTGSGEDVFAPYVNLGLSYGF